MRNVKCLAESQSFWSLILTWQAALSLPSYMTILEVAKKMSDFRTDAAILLDQEDRLEGIVTDNDIAR